MMNYEDDGRILPNNNIFNFATDNKYSNDNLVELFNKKEMKSMKIFNVGIPMPRSNNKSLLATFGSYEDDGTISPSSNIFNFQVMKIGLMSSIKQIIFNDPAVIVYWDDGTKTVAKCLPNDTFNPEIGLAMAISRKYYESIGYPNPRAAFKRDIKNATDYNKDSKK